MKQSFGSRLKHAWDVFRNNDAYLYKDYGTGSFYRPDRPRLSTGNERSIVTSIYNRIALDLSAVKIRRVRLDDNDRYKGPIDSGLNDCITVEANADQTARAFIQDMVISMFDEGCVAIVPTDTSFDPEKTESYDILSMRTAKILQWFPERCLMVKK